MAAKLVRAGKTAWVPNVSVFRLIRECSSAKQRAELKSEAKKAQLRRSFAGQ